MHHNNLVYSWRGNGTDPEFVVEGMRERIDDFIASHPQLDIPSTMELDIPAWNK